MSRSSSRVVVLFLLTMASGCGREAPPAENLVLVTIDTLRADRVGVYGGEVATPNLDRIAGEGTFARNAIAQVPLTRPSHLSLFTGRYPFEHGVRENVAPRFEADMPLLAELLSQSGFRTAGFVSSIVLSSESGMDRGFETFSDDFGDGDEVALFLDSVQKRGDQTTGEAIAWLREPKDGRFFVWLHLYDPHDPYDPPEPYASLHRDRPYDGEVAFADDLVGRLDRTLAELGLSDTTLLVVTSDHGEAFGEHGETGHGYFIYDTTLRVPLILRGPGIEPSGEIEVPVESVDLLPTLLELLGLTRPELELSGRSLAAAFGDVGEPEPKPIYSESFMASLLYGWGELVSLREGAWKLIEAPRPELYQLGEDPGEMDNRLEREPRVREQLRAKLEALLSGSVSATSSGEIDPDLVEKLGALGYVGSRRSRTSSRSDIDPKDKLELFRFLNANMREGLTFLEQKRYGEAVERFQTIVDTEAESFQGRYYLGRALYALDRFREAVSTFESALTLDPNYGPAYLDLAEAHLALGQEEEAVSVWRRGQEALPASALLHEREGEYWTSRRRPREAARAFEAVVERVPDDALARARLGEQYRDLGEVESSIRQLREAVRLAPDGASYWNSLGMVLGGNDRLQEAEEAFRKAHAIDPVEAQFAFNLALALERLGRVEEAIPFFRKALENNPRFDPARIELRRLEGR